MSCAVGESASLMSRFGQLDPRFPCWLRAKGRRLMTAKFHGPLQTAWPSRCRAAGPWADGSWLMLVLFFEAEAEFIFVSYAVAGFDDMMLCWRLRTCAFDALADFLPKVYLSQRYFSSTRQRTKEKASSSPCPVQYRKTSPSRGGLK